MYTLKVITDRYLKIIKKDYPNATLENIKVFDEGWDYLVIVIDNKHAFRFPKTKEYANKLPIEANFLKELTKRTIVDVPQLKLREDKGVGNYAIYSFIPGVQFTEDLVKTFKKPNLLTIAHKFGQFLTDLHSFPITTAKNIGIEQKIPIIEWEKSLDKIRKVVFSHISPREQNWIIDLYGNFLQHIEQYPFETRVIHFDIMPVNIIVDPIAQTLSGIIDFGDVEIGDPAFDFALLHWYGDDFLQETYKSYKLPRDTNFEIRRKFYGDQVVLSRLKHFIEIKKEDKINAYKRQLKDYAKEI